MFSAVKTINFLTSKYWPLVCLVVAFLSYYAFNRGAAATWIEVGSGLVVVNIIFRKYGIRQIFSRPMIVFIGLFFFIFVDKRSVFPVAFP